MAVDHIGALSPLAVLATALDEVADIEYVVLFVGDKDGESSYVSWSKCELRDTAFAIQMIQRQFDKTVDEDDGKTTEGE